MDLAHAIHYIQKNGSSIEQARLNFLLYNQPAPPEIVIEFFSSQNQDGSWSPFWAANYNSLDATCFHLAQAHQLGVNMNDPAIRRAVTFIANRQKSDGTWEEEQSIAEIAPPWAKPGDIPAKLYLTANCGYWLVLSETYQEKARIAGAYLAKSLDERGQLSSFIQTRWLSVGIWQEIDMEQQAKQVMQNLRARLSGFSANNLTWMITSLRTVKIPVNAPLITEAMARLMLLQQKNGSWQSDDGLEYTVHATLEALFALKLCEKI